MNAKILEGLKAVRNGIDLILEGYELEKTISNAEPAKIPEAVEAVETAEIVEETTKPEPVAEEAESSVKDNLTREQLDGMTYNNIKKLAKELGVSAVGNREDITARILGETVEAEPEAVVKEEPAKTETETVEPEAVEVDEKDNDPLYAKVVEAISDMDSEDLADILADIGISAKGKRETLVEKIVQAVRDGLLDFDDEEEEEAEEAPAPVADKKTKTKEEPAPAPVESEEDEEDLTNDIDNPEMTEARRKAIIAQDDSIRKQYAKGEVTRDNLVEFLQSFYDTEEGMDDMTDDELLDTYIDAVCRLVDDDGDLVEEGAYTLNGEPACCGRVLSYSEDTNVFICEHCGEEYEAE